MKKNSGSYEVLNFGKMNRRLRRDLVFEKKMVIKDISDLRRSYAVKETAKPNMKLAEF